MILFSLQAFGSNSCDELARSSRLLKLVNQIETYSDQTMLWPNQDLQSFTYVLTDLDISKNCALVLYNNLNREFVATKDIIEYRNTTFEFYVNSFNPPKNKELKTFFKRNNITVAYAQNFTDLTSQTPAYLMRLFGFENGNFYINLLLHEGFHLFTKFPNKNNWFNWTSDLSFDRDEVFKKCYSDPRVKSVFYQEFNSIESAFELLEFYGDIELAGEAIKDYYKHREKRQAILQNISIQDTLSGEPISCLRAEIVMEHEEGIAEFFGNVPMLNANLMSNQNLFYQLRYVRNGQAYYSIGLVKQLFLFRKLGRQYISTVEEMINKDDFSYNQDYYVKQNL